MQARLVVLAMLAAGCFSSEPVARTTLGTVVGIFVHDSVINTTSYPIAQFMGIPYAPAPIAERRFVHSTESTEHFPNGTLVASRAGPKCPSTGQLGKDVDESCLFLNIWTPADALPAERRASAPGLPCLVFIHGGAFVDGAGSEYNGTHLAALTNAIVVTLNYRLGVLGFLQHTSGVTNFGHSDQITALQWVAAYIGAFGGDATRVTIFGESAGGISCLNLLLSPRARGLFRRVISESGFPSGSDQADSLALSSKFLNASGCTMADAAERLACLQGLSLAAVSAADKQVVPPNSNPFKTHGYVGRGILGTLRL